MHFGAVEWGLRLKPPPLIALLYTGLALLIAACGGSDAPAPTPTLAPSPVVSAVPSAVPVDLTRAQKLYRDGDIDEALRLYSAAVLRGSPEQRQAALWQIARIQYEKGENDSAAQNVRAFLATRPAPEDERRAHLLLGYAELAQGHQAAARESLEKYVETDGPAAPYAQLQLAELAYGADNKESAAELAGEAISAALPPPALAVGLLALARYQEAADDAGGALATLDQAVAQAPTASDAAEALWQIAETAGRSGDGARQQQALHRLVAGYPWHRRALEAVNLAQFATARERGLVLFRHGVNAQAAEVYLALMDDPDPVVRGEARYRLGILAERAADPGQALNEYAAAIEALAGTGSLLLGDAHWDRGLVFESIGRLDDAVYHYSIIADVAPASEHVSEALFRAGMIRYRQAIPGDALTLWSRYVQLAPDAESQTRAAFWTARAAAALGDFTVEAQSLADAAAASPYSYYGLRARAILDGTDPGVDPVDISPPTNPWPKIESWIEASVGPEPTPTSGLPASGSEDPDPSTPLRTGLRTTTEGSPSTTGGSGFQPDGSPALARARELLLAGLMAQAEPEFEKLIHEATDGWELYRLAREMHEHGQTRLAARAATRLAALSPGPPPELLTLQYPARFLGPASEAAAASNVSPLLLLALVRQESFFDASAVSPAGALGLTQVIPPTAREIAGDLGEQGFKEADLLDPDVSLRFGAHYLSAQLEGFGGNVSAALAAYNGGPGNAGRWVDASGGDPDLFLETIDFEETRLYVELVLGNYAIYRYAYGVADRLALPLP